MKMKKGKLLCVLMVVLLVMIRPWQIWIHAAQVDSASETEYEAEAEYDSSFDFSEFTPENILKIHEAILDHETDRVAAGETVSREAGETVDALTRAKNFIN